MMNRPARPFGQRLTESEPISGAEKLLNLQELFRPNGADELHPLLNAVVGQLKPAELDLERLLDDVVADKVQDALAKGIDFRLHVETDLPPVLADSAGLTNALAALLDNAVGQTPAGGRLTVGLYQDSGWLWLAVADSGAGLTEADQAAGGNRFNQAERRLTQDQAGLGLAQAVVRAAGGQLQLYSRMGQGSCVTIRLPAVRRPADSVGRSAETPARAQPERSLARKPIPVWVLEARSLALC